MKLNTYLNYGGNCAEAFRFYEKELGGKIGMLMTHDQAPGADQCQHGVGEGCASREHHNRGHGDHGERCATGTISAHAKCLPVALGG
jgi:uncharacterized glyoxalase superfamily protein PhnB